jgi:hypothetical protein
MQQLNLQVSTSQITLPIDFENIFLPNNVIIVRNHGDDEEFAFSVPWWFHEQLTHKDLSWFRPLLRGNSHMSS